jgi:hypothetical protein
MGMESKPMSLATMVAPLLTQASTSITHDKQLFYFRNYGCGSSRFGSAYAPFIRYILRHLKSSKEFQRKMLHVHLHIQHAHEVVARKNIFCSAYVKSTKIRATISLFGEAFFVFFCTAQKKNVEHGDIHADIFLNF